MASMSVEQQPLKQSSMRVFNDDDSYPELDSVPLKTRVTNWVQEKHRGHQDRAARFSALDWVAFFLPCVTWLRTYSVRHYLAADIIAGLSIGFMVVPQGMSYALLAGLPAVYGLYGALVPPFVYALFGSSRHLAVGPVAVTSLLLSHNMHAMFPESEAIDDPNKPGSPELEALQTQYNTAVVQITVLVAIFWTAAGLFRLSYLANFLSHSVISGFTSGAAIIIGISQLKYFLGVKIPNTDTALDAAIELGKVIGDTNWREFVMGVVWLVLLLSVKTVAKRYPRLSWLRPLGPITVAVVSILAVVIGDLDGQHLIRTVKHVPSGLPGVSISTWFPLFDAGAQIKTALILFVVDFLENISISKAVARKHNYELNVPQELTAMGAANFFGGMFGSYTATGSFSRTAVCSDIGGKTALHGIVTGFVVMIVLLFITPVFERIPYNAMGAIIISAVSGLFEYSEALFLFRANKLDWLVWMAAFLGTVFAGVEIGLAIAIGLALLLVVYQTASPHIALLGRLPGTEVYRNVKQYPAAAPQPHLCIVRVDAPIYFANVEGVRTKIEKYVERANADAQLGPVFFVILDMAPVAFVDATGMHAFDEIVRRLRSANIQLVLANPSRRVQAQLRRG